MLSFEEALAIAMTYRDNLGHCAEWENGYAFEPKADGNDYVGGPGSPIVVLKKDGSVKDMVGFITSKGGGGKLIREFDFDAEEDPESVINMKYCGKIAEVAYIEPADYFPKEIRKKFKLGEFDPND